MSLEREQRLKIRTRGLVGDDSMSLRSRRKSLAQGKRSYTKWREAQPWVKPLFEFLARFSGRQMTDLLSPAKAGSIFHFVSQPRVPLAALASPWAKLCRLLRRLIAIFDLNWSSFEKHKHFAGLLGALVIIALFSLDA